MISSIIGFVFGSLLIGLFMLFLLWLCSMPVLFVIAIYKTVTKKKLVKLARKGKKK